MNQLSGIEELIARVAELEARLAAAPALDRASLYRMTDLSPWAVLAVDAEGRLDYANPACAPWMGGAAAATGTRLESVWSPKLWPALAKALEQATAGGTTDTEVAIASSQDAAGRIVRLIVMPRYSGPAGITGAIVNVHDLTESLTRDTAVRDNEARLRLAIQAGRLAVWEFNAGVGLTINEDLKRLLGYPRDAPVTQQQIEAGYVPEDWQRLRDEAQAVLAAGSSAVEAELRHLGPDGVLRSLLFRIELVLGAEGQVVRGQGVVVDISEQKKAEEGLRLVINELNHRVKNSLATVQSMALQTLRSAPDLDTAAQDLEARIVSLAAAHDLITEANWVGADIKALVVRALASVPAERLSLSGPNLMAPPRVALSLSLALHELLTNAYKHGALAGDAGSLAVTWLVQAGEGGSRMLRLEWRETDGPPVTAPLRRGFGSRLLQKALAAELNGEVTLEFPRTGAVCAIAVPLGPPRAAP